MVGQCDLVRRAVVAFVRELVQTQSQPFGECVARGTDFQHTRGQHCFRVNHELKNQSL